MNIVLDTNVLISATMWNNSVSHRVLKKLINEEVKIFTSIEILREYQKVLIRDFKYSKEECEAILIKLLNALNIIKTDIKIDVVKEDPDDNKIIECAISSDSGFILTYDKHLLRLKDIKGIGIIQPEDFEFIKRTEEAYEEHEKGRFVTMNVEEFLEEMKRW